MVKKAICTAVLCAAAVFGVILSVSCTKRPESVDVYILEPYEYLLRDETPEDYDGPSGMSASLAGNETESLQFVLNFGFDATEVRAEVGQLRSDAGDVLDTELFRQHYIEVKTPTTDDFEPGWYPDALIPMYDGSDGGFANDSCDVPQGQNCGFWINVNAAPDQPAGEYSGTVSVSCAELDEPVLIDVTATVWDFSLSDQTESSTCFGVWMDHVQSYGEYKGYEDVDYGQLSVDYSMFLLDKYRICPTYAPYSIDTQLAEFAEYVSNPRVSQYAIPCAGQYDEANGVFTPSEATVRFVQILREAGLLDKGVFYVTDEPADDEATNAKLAAINRALKELCPECPNIVTTAPRPSCYGGVVDAWCGLFNAPSMYEENIRYRQSLAETVWWYGCVTPEYPYPNYQLTNDLLNIRLISWMQRDYNISANLFWSTTVMRKFLADQEIYTDRDVWTDPNAFGSSPGDGYLLYPGFEGDGIVGRNEPVPTIRINNIRDGIEDYIYLEMVEAKLSSKLQALGASADIDMLMDSFYDALYDSVGSINYDGELVKTARAIAAEQILSDEPVIISHRPYTSEDIVNGRRVEVYAEPGLKVTVDGSEAEEIPMGSYSLYVCCTDVAEGVRRASVEVDGQSYSLLLPANTDESWINELVRKVYSHTNALGLYGDEYIQNYKDNFAGDGLASDPARLSSIASELAVDVPVVVQNSLSLTSSDGKPRQSMRIYVPEGASVEVDGQPAELDGTEDGISVYLYECVCEGAYVEADITVSYRDRTQTLTKYMPCPISEFTAMYDMSSQSFKSAVLAANPNTELSFGSDGLTAHIGITSLSLTVPVSGTAVLSDLRDYDVMYISVRNSSDSDMQGLTVELTGASSAVSVAECGALAPGQSALLQIDLSAPTLPEQLLGDLLQIWLTQGGTDIREDVLTLQSVSVAKLQ